MKPKTKSSKNSSVIASTSNESNTNEAALISVLDNLPVGVVIFSLSNILFINKFALKILKPDSAAKKDITQYSIFDFLLPQYHQRSKDNYAKIFQGKEFTPFELKIKNAKGQTVDLEIKSNAIVFNGEKVLQTILTDVSERVKIREELAESKINLDLVTKNAHDLIYFYTNVPKLKYVYISPSVKKILGYSEEDFYTDPHLLNSMIVDKKAYVKFELGIRSLQKNNKLKDTNGIFQYKTKSGKLVWLEVNYSPIYDDNGKIKLILGISRDITAEKSAQLELEQKWNNYKSLLDSSPVGIFIHKGNCIYSNKMAANILEEKNPNKLIGKDLIAFIVPEQQQLAKERVRKAFHGHESSGNLTYQVKTVKGKIIEVELRTAPFIYNGEPCAQTIIASVSSEKLLAKEILRAELAEESNKKLTNEIEYRKKIQDELVIQTTKYEAIFNNTSHLIWTIDRDLKITTFNDNYYNYIYKISNHKLKKGQHISLIGSNRKDELKVNFWIKFFTNFFKDKADSKVEFFELRNTDLKGKIFYREIYLHPIRGVDGTISEVAIIGHDSTERRLTEEKILKQSAKLNAIFESGTQLIWTVDRNFFYTSFNTNFSNALYELYGVRPSLDKKLYKPQKTKAGIAEQDWWIDKYNEAFLKGKSIEFTTDQVGASGSKIYRQIFLNPILRAGLVEEISCVSTDITELRFLQNESINQAAKLTSIFESSSHLIWTVDKNFSATSFNSNFSKVFEDNYGVSPELNKQLHLLIPKNQQREYKENWYAIYKKVFSGKPLKLERKQLDIRGGETYQQIYLNPVRNGDNEIVEIACLAHDITETKRFEKQILDQASKLKAIFESGDHLMWTITRDLKLSSFNQNYANSVFDLYKSYPEIGKSVHMSKKDGYDVIWDEKYDLVFQGKQVEFISERTQLSGQKVIRQILLYPIRDLNNNVIEISGIGFDVTANKKNEEKITQSLREKEVLLKEVHHRVKNNMQVISSILNLQSSYVRDEYALNLLKECQNRIKSMAFIHESLYQTKNFESVNFSEYVTTLSKNLVHSYSINSKKVKLILTLDDFHLNLDSSIPCGLIINEIISNSLKYAFPDNRDGIIFVTLQVDKDKVRIEVGDNGVGISECINIKKTQTLGLQLVDTLVEQIGGTLKLSRNKGTIFSIEFNK